MKVVILRSVAGGEMCSNIVLGSAPRSRSIVQRTMRASDLRDAITAPAQDFTWSMSYHVGSNIGQPLKLEQGALARGGQT